MSENTFGKPQYTIGDKVKYKKNPELIMCIVGYGTSRPHVSENEIELYWNGTYLCKWINDERGMTSFYKEEVLEKIGRC